MTPRSPPGLHKRTIFGPQCTHLTMTRLYSPDILCGNCHSPGPFGWLYQCIQDRDDLIEQAVSRGEFANMDELGCCLTSNLGVRQGSPAAREDTLSFFKEITQKQLSSYRPDQVADILRQRENVQLVIQREQIRKDSAAILTRLTQPNGLDSAPCHYDFQKPWVCGPHEECQYRICQRCRPGSSDRAFLSLDAVAKGEIPPSAAAGFGFHILGRRPIVDAAIIKTLGCRPVPLPQSTGSSENSSPTSSVRVMELLDAQIAQGRMLWDGQKEQAEIEEDSDDDFGWPETPTTPDSPPDQLEHAPGCENLALYAVKPPVSCAGSITPLLLTPLPSPLPDGASSAGVRLEESVELGVLDLITQA